MIEKNLKRITVALVLEDRAVAHRLATELKQLNILSYYYDNLRDFWRESLKETPDLTIIDVKKMSDGDMILKNHPRLKDDKLALAFYHNDQTKFLLSSTFGIHNYGVINGEFNLSGQLKSTLARLNNESDIKEQTLDYEKTVERLRNRTARLITDISEFKSREDFNKETMDLVNEIQFKMKNSSFIESAISVFSNWARTINFGCYELNASAQKLVAPVFKRNKYHELPSLWLGQLCKDGITENAQNMSVQVAIDQFGMDVVTLKVNGDKKQPSLLFYFEADKNTRENMPWDLFSKLLSGLFANELLSKVNNTEMTKSETFMSSWSLMNEIDEHHYNLKAAKIRLVNLSFNNLIEAIKSKPKNRFYWKTFYNDFIQELEKNCGANFKISEFGTYSLNFLVPTENLDQFMNGLEDFVIRFSYWRYFEDPQALLTVNLFPEFKEIPLTSYSLLNHLDREFDDIDRAVSLAASKAKKLFTEMNAVPRKQPRLDA